MPNPFDAANQASASPNPFDAVNTKPSGTSASEAPPPPSNPFDAANTPAASASKIPDNGIEPDEPWYKQAWGWVNKPLVDVDDALGRTGQAGGFERGASDLVSGLTSPLSIALTLGTFGAGGLIESGAMSVLREAGLAGAELADVTNGAKVLSQAVKAGHTFDEGLEAARAAGVNPDTLMKGLDALKKANLGNESLTASGIIRSGGSAALRKLGVTAATSDKVGAGLQALVSAGFTAQNALQAAELSPKVLDALKDGDYETAERLGIDALGTGAMAGLGTHEVLSESGGAMDDAAAKAGLQVKPSETNIQLRNLFGVFDKDIATTGRTSDLWAQDIRKIDPKATPEQLERIKYYVESGLDENLMAQRHDLISEIADAPDTSINAFHGSPSKFPGAPRTDGLGAHFTLDKTLADKFAEGKGQTVAAKLNIKNPLRMDDYGGSHANAEGVIKDFVKQGALPESFLKDIDSRIYTRSQEIVGDTGELQGPKLAAKRNAAFEQANTEELEKVKQYLKSKGYDGIVYDNKAEGHGDSYIAFNPEQIRVPDNGQPATTGMTPERVRELVDSKAMKEKYSPKELDKLQKAYDPAQLSDTDKQIAKEIVDKHNDTLEQAQKDGNLGEGVEAYSTNIWKPEDQDNPVANRLAQDARSGKFAQNTSQARARMFDSSFEGQLLGKKLAETDPIALAAHNANTFGRLKAAQDLRDNLLDQGTKSREGTPLFALAGSGQIDPETGSVFVNPQAKRVNVIANKVVQGLRDKGDLAKLEESGKIINLTKPITPENIQEHIDRLENQAISQTSGFDDKGNNLLRQQVSLLKAIRDGKLPVQKLDNINDMRPSVYVWNPKEYGFVDHPMMRGVKHVAQTPSGDNVYVKSDVLVHPDALEYMKRRLGVDSQGPGEGPVGKTLLKVNKEGKGLLLFGSPFHIAQEGLRGLMSGISPFGIEKWDLANDPVLSKGVENGLTLGKDYRGLSAFKDGELKGNSGIISKVPVLNRVQAGLDSFLFDKYVPGLKARAYKSLVDRYKSAYPDWTDSKVAETAAADTNERFGGINYARLGRSAATQNWLRLSTLAPDWLQGEVQSIMRPFGTEGKVARTDMLRATAALWTTARVLNYLNTGQFHPEAPFGVATKDDQGKEKIYSIRTLPTDMLHAVSDPVGFVQNRMSPLVKTGTQMVTGRDEMGRKLAKSNLAVDFLRSVAPIPIQSTVQMATGQIPETNLGEQGAKAAGLTVQPYRTEAGKLAARLASNHSESGPVDPAQVGRHQMIQEFEGRVRSGSMTMPQIYKMVVDGNLSQSDGKRIQDNLKATNGMDPEMADLYSRSSRLAAPELLQVYESGTPLQKQMLLPMMEKKSSAYYKKAFKDLTPEERRNDPTLLKLRQILPHVSPF